MAVADSPVTCSISLEAPGRRLGRLVLPRSSNTAGWASTYIPLACVVNGSGPTVLVLAGNHGDEYAGQIAALRLARELRVEQVSGRVIVIPCLSPAASKAGTRLWPSGANFNRSFPGSPSGPAHEQLADYLTRVLFPLADAVIDIHTGGNTAYFIPCSHMHVVNDPAQRAAMLAGMLAWNSDHHFLYIDIAGTGLLPVEAEEQGKVVVTTELGGGTVIPGSTHRLARDGLANVLRHLGVLEGEVVTRASLGLPPAVILDGRDPRNYVAAPEAGLFESFVDAGEVVAPDQPIGAIHFMERPDRAPEVLTAPLDGVVAALRAITATEQGDNVIVLGQPIEASALA
jgi:N-alpha-acetyl-L-2,4-diaminobutyrate deacetylase